MENKLIYPLVIKNQPLILCLKLQLGWVAFFYFLQTNQDPILPQKFKLTNDLTLMYDNLQSMAPNQLNIIFVINQY